MSAKQAVVMFIMLGLVLAGMVGLYVAAYKAYQLYLQKSAALNTSPVGSVLGLFGQSL